MSSGWYPQLLNLCNKIFAVIGHYSDCCFTIYTLSNPFYCVSSSVVLKIASKINQTEGGVQPTTNIEQGDSSAQIDDTTKMVDNGETTETRVLEPLGISRTLISSSTTLTPPPTIEDYLAKPVLCKSSTLGTADEFGSTNLFGPWAYPNVFMAITPWNEKLRGFLYFRATLVLTLQVNASPMHCGLYYLAHVPTGGSSVIDTTTALWLQNHTYSVQQRSQLPHAEISLGTQTSTTLRIPYVSAFTGTTVANSNDNAANGHVYLYPISPLAIGAGGDTTVGYSVWAHWEDVELNVPVSPHSGALGRGRHTNQPSVSLSSSKPMSADSEQSNKGIGPITSAIKAGRLVADSLCKVPLLSSIAAPASWALEIVGNITGIFGWSKPRNATVQTPVVLDYMYGVNFIDSSDNSRLLAMSNKNTIEILPGFSGTDIDELSLDAFLTRPTINGGFSWPSSSPTTTLLNTFVIGPDSCAVNRVYGSFTSKSLSPMALMAEYFMYWRGDTRVTYRFVKTNFHSGRLLFCFSPYQSTAIVDGSATFTTSVYTWRHVVDVRDIDAISLVFPFTSHSEYRPTTGIDAYIGNIQVFVLDELVAPTTVTQSIEVIVEVSAEPGFEFAVPKATNIVPVYGFPVIATAHSGSMFQGSVEADTIGNSVSQPDKTHESARMCIGEKILSLRQMLRRCPPLARSVVAPFEPTAACTTIYPFAVLTAYLSSSTVMTIPKYYGDWYSLLCSIFALSRGGIRIKTYNSYISDTDAEVWLSHIPDSITSMPFIEGNATDTTGLAVNQQYNNTIYFKTDIETRGGVEVQVPAYSRFHARSNVNLIGFGNVEVTMSNSTITNPPFAVNITQSDTYAYELGRSGADDFNVGQFVSIPVMCAVSSAL